MSKREGWYLFTALILIVGGSVGTCTGSNIINERKFERACIAAGGIPGKNPIGRSNNLSCIKYQIEPVPVKY